MLHSSPFTSVWLLLTSLGLAIVAMLWSNLGSAENAGWYLAGPLSTLGGNTLGAGFSWLCAGVGAVAIDRGYLRRDTALPWLVTLTVLVLYTNIIRERTSYGDVYDYVKAAMNLTRGEAFHPRYIYPPFLAVMLKPLTGWGPSVLVYICILLELLALALFVVLTPLLLMSAGLGRNLAFLLVGLSAIANAPLMRNILYVQANLFVLDALLVCVLLFGRRPALSALGMAVGIYLKMSPALLGVMFLMAWDWRWIGSFLGWMALITVGVTAVAGELGWTSFLTNLRTMGNVSAEAFRDGSADALARHTVHLLSLPEGFGKIMVYSLKGGWILFGIYTVWRLWERHEDQPELSQRHLVMDGVLLWLPLMTLLAPKVWEHHAIFVLPTLLVTLVRLQGRREFVLWLTAWILIFWIPTFDMYLLSWHRVVGIQLGWLVSARALLRESPSAEMLNFSAELDHLLRPSPPNLTVDTATASPREPGL